MAFIDIESLRTTFQKLGFPEDQIEHYITSVVIITNANPVDEFTSFRRGDDGRLIVEFCYPNRRPRRVAVMPQRKQNPTH